MRSICATICISACLTMAGCSATAPQPVSRQLGLADSSDTALNLRFAAERAYLKGRPDHPSGAPVIGLAMSGGGTKAAVFSHGVLHGLQEQGILPRVDLISTTSGGGYAAYWYMSKQLEAQRLHGKAGSFEVGDIFRDCFPAWIVDAADDKALKEIAADGTAAAEATGHARCADENNFSGKDDIYRWQAHLLRWPDVMRKDITTIDGGSAQSRPIGDFIALGISSIYELAFGWLGPTESAVGKRYQFGIERAWGLNPLPRSFDDGKSQEQDRWQYSNGTWEAGGERQLHVDAATMKWEDLKALYATGKPLLPIWILNTNIGDKGKFPDLSHLYELTPFGYGTAKNYTVGTPPLESIALGVRASAGFADSQGIASRSQREAVGFLARFLPGLQWGVPIQDANGGKLRMSDGGGADNLALVSVVRRGPRDVIVVDTAEDVEGSMGDLCWSREALAQEGLMLEMEELSNLAGVCDGLFGRKTADNPQGETRAYNVSAWLNPVLKGTVRWGRSGRTTNIWLIKAAWDQQAARRAFNRPDRKCGLGRDQIDCTVLMFYGHDTDIRTPSGYMLFPQHSTAWMTANSSSKLTLAYRELGRMLAKNLVLDAQGHLQRATKETCRQPWLPLKEGTQPQAAPRSPSHDPRVDAECRPLGMQASLQAGQDVGQ